jgi:hypothetical protein
MADEVKKTSADLLLEVIMQREARLAKKEQEEENRQLAKAKQYEQNAASQNEDYLVLQTKCNHLKGGKNRRRIQAKDYNVRMHVFTNHEVTIRCCNCGMKWKNKDTREYLVRQGKKIPNHTKLGWEDALEFVSQSSNEVTKSEIWMNSTPVVFKEVQ